MTADPDHVYFDLVTHGDAVETHSVRFGHNLWQPIDDSPRRRFVFVAEAGDSEADSRPGLAESEVSNAGRLGVISRVAVRALREGFVLAGVLTEEACERVLAQANAADDCADQQQVLVSATVGTVAYAAAVAGLALLRAKSDDRRRPIRALAALLEPV